MPLYNYKCPSCGRKKEFLLPISHRAPLCPHCCYNPERDGEHEVMVRDLSGGTGGFNLKGSGWAADGYGNKKSGSCSTGGG